MKKLRVTSLQLGSWNVKIMTMGLMEDLQEIYVKERFHYPFLGHFAFICYNISSKMTIMWYSVYYVKQVLKPCDLYRLLSDVS